MTEEQKYIFDIQGYIVLKDVVPQAVIDYGHRYLPGREMLLFLPKR
jgi:hypothetical protein